VSRASRDERSHKYETDDSLHFHISPFSWRGRWCLGCRRHVESRQTNDLAASTTVMLEVQSGVVQETEGQAGTPPDANAAARERHPKRVEGRRTHIGQFPGV
jgi:hypothetical protein